MKIIFTIIFLTLPKLVFSQIKSGDNLPTTWELLK